MSKFTVMNTETDFCYEIESNSDYAAIMKVAIETNTSIHKLKIIKVKEKS